MPKTEFESPPHARDTLTVTSGICPPQCAVGGQVNLDAAPAKVDNDGANKPGTGKGEGPTVTPMLPWETDGLVHDENVQLITGDIEWLTDFNDTNSSTLVHERSRRSWCKS